MLKGSRDTLEKKKTEFHSKKRKPRHVERFNNLYEMVVSLQAFFMRDIPKYDNNGFNYIFKIGTATQKVLLFHQQLTRSKSIDALSLPLILSVCKSANDQNGQKRSRAVRNIISTEYVRCDRLLSKNVEDTNISHVRSRAFAL